MTEAWGRWNMGAFQLAMLAAFDRLYPRKRYGGGYQTPQQNRSEA
jgi:hypothetical protein